MRKFNLFSIKYCLLACASFCATTVLSQNDGYLFFASNQEFQNRYIIKNSLKKILKLGKVRTSCTCADVKYLKSELQPGESTELIVTLKANSLSGPFTHTIYVATDNPFRFSSEYHNDITGLVEYIYRKYDPVMGRWINRDPIEEQGGVNLYRITYNNSIDLFDTKGLVGLKVKLLLIYAIRFYSMRGHSGTYELDDDNQELLDTVYDKIHQKMKEYSKANGLSRKWKRFVLPYTGMGEIKKSNNYFLNGSNGGVFTKGNFYARCYNGGVLARNATMLYFWHDEIDANSTEETIARYYTNNGKIDLSGYLSDIPHQLENAWDEHAEKYMVPNFRVIVKGNYNFIYEKLL